MPETRSTVRFAEQHNETVLFCTSAYSKSLWYTQEDFREWKRSSRNIAKSWREKGFGVLLDDTFERPSSDAQKQITAFVRLDDENYVRGMERYLNQEHDEERTAMKERAMDGFLRYQRRFQRRGDCCPEESAEHLSLFLQDCSHGARRFAERMGVADAIVAREGENPNEACHLLADMAFQPAPSKLARWSTSGSVNDAANAPQLPRQPMRSQAPFKEEFCSLPEAALENDLSFRFERQRLEREKKDCPGSPSSPLDERAQTSQNLMGTTPSLGYCSPTSVLYTLQEQSLPIL